MIQMRKNVFETNSSSTHSLAYKPKNNILPNKINKEEALNQLIEIGASYNKTYRTLNIATIDPSKWEFGWQHEVHNDFATKFLYVLKCYQNDIDKIKSILITISKYLNVSTIYLPQMIELAWDSEIKLFNLPGYIDHESLGMLHETLLWNDIDLYDFLLDQDYFLLLDSEG